MGRSLRSPKGIVCKDLSQRDHRRHCSLGSSMRQQDAQVLDRGDQVILNLLAPESSPASALEVMIVGRVSKALFHELLPALSIPSRGATMGLFPCYIEGRLLFMSFKRAPELRSGALRAQNTCGAGSAAHMAEGVAHCFVTFISKSQTLW
jgi:hypothetical protein